MTVCKNCGTEVRKSYIYALQNPAWKDWIKIGRTKNLTKRQEQFNTSSPFRDYKVIHSVKVKTKYVKKIEKQILDETKKYKGFRSGEWRKIKLKKIKKIFYLTLKKYHSNPDTLDDFERPLLNFKIKSCLECNSVDSCVVFKDGSFKCFSCDTFGGLSLVGRYEKRVYQKDTEEYNALPVR